MKMSIQVGKSSGDTEQWMQRLIKSNPSVSLNSVGDEILSNLKSSTPSETGTLAGGWRKLLERTTTGYVLGIYNVAYPEIEGNLALMMDRGHGTKNGGYVRGHNYIRPAIKSGLNRFNRMDFLHGGK